MKKLLLLIVVMVLGVNSGANDQLAKVATLLSDSLKASKMGIVESENRCGIQIIEFYDASMQLRHKIIVNAREQKDISIEDMMPYYRNVQTRFQDYKKRCEPFLAETLKYKFNVIKTEKMLDTAYIDGFLDERVKNITPKNVEGINVDYSFFETDWSRNNRFEKKNIEREQCTNAKYNVGNQTYRLLKILNGNKYDINEDIIERKLNSLNSDLSDYEKSCKTLKGNSKDYKNIVYLGAQVTKVGSQVLKEYKEVRTTTANALIDDLNVDEKKQKTLECKEDAIRLIIGSQNKVTSKEYKYKMFKINYKDFEKKCKYILGDKFKELEKVFQEIDSAEKLHLTATNAYASVKAMAKVADKKKRIEREAEAYKNRKNYDVWVLNNFIRSASSLALSEKIEELKNDDEYTLSGRCDVIDVTAFDGQYGIKCANRFKNLKATLYTTDRQKAISLHKGSSFMYKKLHIKNFYTTKEIKIIDNVEYSKYTQNFEYNERLSNEVVGIVELLY